MNILVTGASGFLGTALCSRLETEGHEVVKLNSKNCDLTRRDSLLRFNGTVYDHIYHLAAWTQAGDFCLYHPGEQWIINQEINTYVLAWWQKYQPQAKMICMGTSCAYAPDTDLREEQYLSGMPIDSLFTYAMTKRMLYAGLLALHRQFQLRYLCLVPSTLYGPGYHTDGRQMHFIFDLIRKILRGKFLQESVVLWGDGYQRRELVFIDDFVDILLTLAPSFDNQLINIGAGKEFTIRRFAEIICRKIGYDPDRIHYDASRYVGAKSKCLNVGLLRSLLPEYRLTPLEVGIGKTIEWFMKQKSFGVNQSQK